MEPKSRPEGSKLMKNIWIICRKELRPAISLSPIAYILLVMFAVIFGFFFWNITQALVSMAMESQMEGETMPINLNDQFVRPLLVRHQFDRTVSDPHDHDAPVCRGKAYRDD